MLVFVQPRVWESPVFESQVVDMLDAFAREGPFAITLLTRNPRDYPGARHVVVEHVAGKGPVFARALAARLHSLAPEAVIARNPNVIRYWPVLRHRPLVYLVKGLFHREMAEWADPWSRIKAPLFAATERFLLRRAALVLPHSQRMADHLARSLGVAPGRMRVLPSCCAGGTLPNRRDSGPIRICFAGSTRPWERLADTDRLFARLERRPDVECRFHLRGRPDFTRRSRAPVTRLAREAVLPALLECDVGVLLGHPDSFARRHASPIKFAEYLAAGLAVLSDRWVGDLPEVLAGREFGFVAEGPEDPRVDVWLDRLSDPAVRARVKRKARAYADGHLTWEAHAAGFAAAVKEAIARRRASR